MKRLLTRISIGAVAVVAMAVVASLPVGQRSASTLVDAAGACPITIRIHGSTTVQPMTVAAQPIFDSAWAPGTSESNVYNGSGNGITDLTAGNADDAQSSRPLKQTTGETTGKYVWQIAKDSFVIGVENDPSMTFLTNPDRTSGPASGLTVANLTQIYNAGAGITTLKWSDLVGAGPSWPARPIVPIARITGSGSRPAFDSAIGVPDANEDATIVATGLGRKNESSDMADDVSANVDHIGYTSLSQIASHPSMLVVAVAGLVPDVSNVDSYALARQLFITTRDTGLVNRIDNSVQVRADDWINFMRSPQGDAIIAAEGYPTIPAASVPPIPDWDINLDGTVSLGDLGGVANHWGLTSSCKGWIRADGNNDGKVSLGDIGSVTSHWGQDGLICDGVAAPDNLFHPGTHDCQHG